MRFRILSILVIGCALLAPAAPAHADDDPSFVTFQLGAFDLLQGRNQAGAFALEYRDNSQWWLFKPFMGAMGTSDGGFNAYAGVMVDIYLWRRVVFTLSFAPSFYEKGAGVELGLPLEFRSAGELAYRFDDRSRLGIMVNHLSNAGLGFKNPGTEVIMLSYSVPVGKFMKK
ncbi:MAG: acyloxyacyl hydrolase [Alphaproteobacteria bacterium]|nr:acyloxyacyl hydrolase [Alphaproteobacteria bacterium]